MRIFSYRLLNVSPDTLGTDVADKLNLIGPIAEQCQHQYVSRSSASVAASKLNPAP